MSCSKANFGLLILLILCCLAISLPRGEAYAAALDDEENSEKLRDRPAVLAPADGAEIPEAERPTCPEGQPCPLVRIKGIVPEGLWPFVLVAPLHATPKMWVQPPVTSVRRDGTFNAVAFCGTDEPTPGEYFDIFIVAHRDRSRLERGLVITNLPSECQPESADCMVSDPVTVYRTH